MEFDLENYQPVPVRYELRYMMLKRLQDGEDPLPNIQGREETKKDLIRAVLSNSHPYLVSREGTGKTRLAESLAKLLPPVPKIKGCPYNCDPKWPRKWKCPTCRDVEDPDVEFIYGKQRYSRIQGNEYTNAAKILGLKDIQAIVSGESPTNPRVFIGTGVLRGNRGVIVVDELPAIPTKVQVLFHPMLQENKIILEEYAWERPIDFFFIATGNPSGFAHVNRIPEPLLDRLELIPMDLPEEHVEIEIMNRERFRVYDDFFHKANEVAPAKQIYIKLVYLKRRVTAPWWIKEVIARTTRYTRDCPNIERGASIRGSIKALDHTYSSTEMRKGHVSNLSDSAEGLRLSLRGRIKIRADLFGFDESPREILDKNKRVVEDIMWYALRDIGARVDAGLDVDKKELANEIDHILALKGKVSLNLETFPMVKDAIKWLEETEPFEPVHLVTSLNEHLKNNPDAVDPEPLADYRYSAVEFLAATLVTSKNINSLTNQDSIFIPKRMEN